MNKIVSKIEVEDFFKFDQKNSPLPEKNCVQGELTREDNVVRLSFIPTIENIKHTKEKGKPFITVRFSDFERFGSGVANFYLKG